MGKWYTTVNILIAYTPTRRYAYTYDADRQRDTLLPLNSTWGSKTGNANNLARFISDKTYVVSNRKISFTYLHCIFDIQCLAVRQSQRCRAIKNVRFTNANDRFWVGTCHTWWVDLLTSLPNVNFSRLSTLAVALGKLTGVPRGGVQTPPLNLQNFFELCLQNILSKLCSYTH